MPVFVYYVLAKYVVDAGLKPLSIDGGMPEPRGLAGVHYQPGGDEHGILTWESNTMPDDVHLKVGDRIAFLPSHIDTTINLHETYYAYRARWEIGGHLAGGHSRESSVSCAQVRTSPRYRIQPMLLDKGDHREEIDQARPRGYEDARIHSPSQSSDTAGSQCAGAGDRRLYGD